MGVRSGKIASDVGRVGLETATNGLADDGSGLYRLNSHYPQYRNLFRLNENPIKLDDFGRFPVIFD